MTSLFVYDSNVKKELKIDVESASVADLYCAVAKLYDHLDNPRKHLSLLFTDKELTFSKKKIIRCGIINGSTIGVVLRLPGGYQATHGAVSDNGFAVATGTTMETGTRELQIEATTTERDEVTLQRENNDNNGILRMRVNDEGREEEKKKKRKKKKRKTKNQPESENNGMRKNSKEFNEENENVNKILTEHLIEETAGGEDKQNSQEKITKKKKTKVAGRTKEDHAKEEVNRPQLRSLPGIEITDKKDFCEISPSVKLPCSHLISSESMRVHCDAELAKGKARFECAACPVQLEYRIVRRVACFTPGEMHSVEKAILDLALGKDGDVFPCSNCKAWTKALDKEAHCLRCFCRSKGTEKRFLFCRNCFKEWKNPSDSRCTNLRCKSYIEPTLEILLRSPIIFPGNNPLFLLWSIYQHRVCPRCGLLTEFTDGCTQVHCKYCSYFYCFVCLKGAKSKEELKCIPYFSFCDLAPVQTEIPIWKSD